MEGKLQLIPSFGVETKDFFSKGNALNGLILSCRETCLFIIVESHCFNSVFIHVNIPIGSSVAINMGNM